MTKYDEKLVETIAWIANKEWLTASRLNLEQFLKEYPVSAGQALAKAEEILTAIDASGTHKVVRFTKSEPAPWVIDDD
jgi:hypothetical protein